MTDWPKLDELIQVFNADPEGNAWDGAADNTRMTRLLEASIQATKDACGGWSGDPTPKLAQAALRAAMLLAPPRNHLPESLDLDPQFAALIRGHRTRFGIS